MTDPTSRIIKTIKRPMERPLESFFLKDPICDGWVDSGVFSVLIFSLSNMGSYLVALIGNKPYAPLS